MTHFGQPWRERQTQQAEKTEDLMSAAVRIGVMNLGADDGIVAKQSGQHVERLPNDAGNRLRGIHPELVRHVSV